MDRSVTMDNPGEILAYHIFAVEPCSLWIAQFLQPGMMRVHRRSKTGAQSVACYYIDKGSNRSSSTVTVLQAATGSVCYTNNVVQTVPRLLLHPPTPLDGRWREYNALAAAADYPKPPPHHTAAPSQSHPTVHPPPSHHTASPQPQKHHTTALSPSQPTVHPLPSRHTALPQPLPPRRRGQILLYTSRRHAIPPRHSLRRRHTIPPRRNLHYIILPRRRRYTLISTRNHHTIPSSRRITVVPLPHHHFRYTILSRRRHHFHPLETHVAVMRRRHHSHHSHSPLRRIIDISFPPHRRHHLHPSPLEVSNITHHTTDIPIPATDFIPDIQYFFSTIAHIRSFITSNPSTGFFSIKTARKGHQGTGSQYR